LTVLGYRRNEANSIVKEILKKHTGKITLEEVIKESLKKI